MSAFRDAGAALARIAALEEENADLRAELEKQKNAGVDGRNGTARELAQLRSQIELLKRKILKAEGRDQASAHAKLMEQRQEKIAELAARHDTLLREIDRRQSEVDQLDAHIEAKKRSLDETVQAVASALTALGHATEPEVVPPPSEPDNRDAVIARLHEERRDLEGQIQILRRELARKTDDKSWLSKVIGSLAKDED